ncbi:uncharacterized protein [Venturia canescens]|uniref:uncharacterized protein n=1 Tax=Venturia canescens TaxID=32260 RepID=UPI001C9C555E|nr:uncharacterized protein LOC122407750 [Venturia canescens]
MEVATSQRPHPPPVPPRPSRQVVAEALKRSPRPPCPTRQAPPPPNTKPWRSEDHEAVPQHRGGRTVVYESFKDSINDTEVSRCSSEPRAIRENVVRSEKVWRKTRSNSEDDTVDRSRNDARCSNKIVAFENGKECGVANEKIVKDVAASERHQQQQREAENNRERQAGEEEKKCEPQPRSSSGGQQYCDWENWTVKTSENGDDRAPDIKKESALIPCIDRGAGKETEMRKKVELFCGSGNDPSEDVLGSEQIGKNSFETLEARSNELPDVNPADIFAALKSGILDANATKNVVNDDSFAKNYHSPRTLATNSITVSEPPTSNPSVNGDKDLDSKHTTEHYFHSDNKDSPLSTRNNSTTTISSDDCTTVVVIDEPERKISFNDDNDNIHHQDWLEAGVRYSSTKITLPGDENIDRNDSSSLPDDDRRYNHDYHDDQLIYSDRDFASIRERIAMSSLQGLPPLPRSLSGFNLNEGRREASEPPPPPTRSSSKTPKNVKSTQPSGSRPSPPGRQLTTLDTQLAILRKEMFGLRQLDLSLLSQLWSLNESIQEFRQLLQEQEDRAPSPSPSSEEGDDTSYGSHPPPPPRRPAPMLHHHRPPRPPRPLRLPASDESPSSEEYGAV